MTNDELVERVAREIAKSDGLDFDEVCGNETDEEYCDSSTCVGANFEDHDPDWARDVYRRHAQAALRALADQREAEVADLKRRLATAQGQGWHPYALDAVKIAEAAIAALEGKTDG